MSCMNDPEAKESTRELGFELGFGVFLGGTHRSVFVLHRSIESQVGRRGRRVKHGQAVKGVDFSWVRVAWAFLP